MIAWQREEIEHILIQLNQLSYPFKEVIFESEDKRNLNLLGKGAFAYIFAAKSKSVKKEYAIKVIGFGSNQADSKSFREAVSSQKRLNLKNVVRVYDFVELNIWLDDENQVFKVETAKDYIEKDCLRLQFVLMEKLKPVLTLDENKRPILYPKTLSYFPEDIEGMDQKTVKVEREKETVKLIYDISVALYWTHEEGVLHRDVKLDNIFYSEKEDCYKLGDFGIAQRTVDGMTFSKAGSPGYIAPEIKKSLDDAFDNTADIYSLGITMFVLLNRMRFPGSNNYRINEGLQYTAGYVVPQPIDASDELYEVIRKMCSFNPDDRYQSMKEVQQALDKKVFGEHIAFAKKHRKASGLLATTFFVISIGLKIYCMVSGEITILQEDMLTTAQVLLLVLCGGLCAESICFLMPERGLTLKTQTIIWSMIIVISVVFCFINISPFVTGNIIYAQNIRFDKVGIGGLFFSIFWLIRCRFLGLYETLRI